MSRFAWSNKVLAVGLAIMGPFGAMTERAGAFADDLDSRWSESARAVLKSVPATIPPDAYAELRDTWLATVRPVLEAVVHDNAGTRGTVMIQHPQGGEATLMFTAAAVARDRVSIPGEAGERSRNSPRFEIILEVHHGWIGSLNKSHPQLAPQAELPADHVRMQVGDSSGLRFDRSDGLAASRSWLSSNRLFASIQVRGEGSSEEADRLVRSLHEAVESRALSKFPLELKVDPVVSSTSKVPASAPPKPRQAVSVRPGAGDPTDTLRWVRIVTSMGDMVVALNETKSPVSVENFLAYVKSGFYTKTTFHRVIPDFMIQGGGHEESFRIKTDTLPPIVNEWRNGLKNKRGTIAMARLGGNPDSATSQFFINVVDNGRLDQPQPDGAAYAVFGSVVDGMETVDRIRYVPTGPRGNARDVPVDPVVIERVELLSESDIKAEWRATPPADAAPPPATKPQ